MTSSIRMPVVIAVVLLLSTFHSLVGAINVCIGITSSVTAEVRLDHHLSPIWSGAMFIITGILGFICAKLRTAYPIIWFTASNVGSLVVAIVSIQLLYRGRSQSRNADSTSLDGITDALTVVALGVSGCECFICMASFIASCSMAKTNKKQLQMLKDNGHRPQEASEPSQENVSECDEEFYHRGSGPPLTAVLNQESFPSAAIADNDPNDFFLSWNLTNDVSLRADACFEREFKSDSNTCPACRTTRLHDDIPGGANLPLDGGLAGEVLEKRYDGNKSPDEAAIYTISPNVNLDHSDISADELNVENHNVAVQTRNGGEKPRLKRIISLIEGECGTFTYNNTT